MATIGQWNELSRLLMAAFARAEALVNEEKDEHEKWVLGDLLDGLTQSRAATLAILNRKLEGRMPQAEKEA